MNAREARSQAQAGKAATMRDSTKVILVWCLVGVIGIGTAVLSQFPRDDLVFDSGDLDASHDPFSPSQPEVTSIELVDGELHVKRLGGNFCSPCLEIYGVLDGSVVLLRTVHPEIVEATERQVIWP